MKLETPKNETPIRDSLWNQILINLEMVVLHWCLLELGDDWILDVSHSLRKIATQTLQTCRLSIVRIDLNKRAMFYQS